MYTFGFIGTGNMGFALAKGISKKINTDEIILSDKMPAKAELAAKELSCAFAKTAQAVQESKYIVLGVKPQALNSVAKEIAPILKSRSDRFIIVTMLAGTSLDTVGQALGIKCPIIRIMPNVACLVGTGMTLCAPNGEVSAEELDFFLDAMSGTGKTDVIDEKFIDAASAISGCGPAYVYMMIEALADGAVDCGIPRDKAYLYAAQTLEGSARLMLETGKHPAELKDSVCSPGGTTIEGVRLLEKGAFRSDIIEAIRAAYQKTLNI